MKGKLLGLTCAVLGWIVLFAVGNSFSNEAYTKRYFDELLKSPAAEIGKEAARKALKRLDSSAAKSGMRYARMTKERLPEHTSEGGSLVQGRFFLVVSESIPQETLRTYAVQAQELAEKGIHVTFLLRGFVDGIRRIAPTIRFYLSFVLKDPHKPPTGDNLRPVELSIDPERVRRVSAVPALMDDKGCVVYGDAPLSYLLRRLTERQCGKTFGATFAVVERDALEEIREAAAKAVPYLERARSKILTELRQIHGVNLPPARKNRTFRIRRTFTLNYDLLSTDGRTVAKAGTYDLSTSPVPLSGIEILVVNAHCPKQIAWLRQELPRDEKPKTILVSGDVGKICGTVSEPCYPLTAELVQVFSLGGTPARITGSTDGTFVVSEFFLP